MLSGAHKPELTSLLSLDRSNNTLRLNLRETKKALFRNWHHTMSKHSTQAHPICSTGNHSILQLIDFPLSLLKLALNKGQNRAFNRTLACRQAHATTQWDTIRIYVQPERGLIAERHLLELCRHLRSCCSPTFLKASPKSKRMYTP